MRARDRAGRADLHIHSLASDGTDGVAGILDRVAHLPDEIALDVIAITDHERIDAALAARAMARERGMRVEIVVGEEITTRGGHLLGLFLEQPVRPLLSLGESIRQVHAQGGLAVVAHPLVPFPLCASERSLLRLLRDPHREVHPDGIETLNPTPAGRPWHGRVVRFAAQHGLAALGNSDAHAATQIGQAYTTFPGHTAEDLRRAILERRTAPDGAFYPFGAQFTILGRQLRKYGRDVRDETLGRLLRPGTGRDLGYPGGRCRPPAFRPDESGR